MKLLLVDDHKLFLEGISQVLALSIEDLTLLKADSVEAALLFITQHNDIDLALVDLAMPDTNGVELIQRTHKLNELLPIAILSACEDINQINQALSQGALGFIPKSYEPKQLISAIEVILTGQIFVPEYLKLLLIQQQERNETITPRQVQVLKLLAQGLANIKIADTLSVSEHTIKSHIKQLYQKLHVDNRISCINQAKILGILPSD